jgi:hypothetical protein
MIAFSIVLVVVLVLFTCSYFNLLLGILLLLFPLGIAELVGAPLPKTHFYPTVLGAVIFGMELHC